MNNASFSNSTITGYGSSLSLIASMSQFLSTAQPFLPLFNQSWTFEAWIHLFEVVGSTDYPILGQCDSFANDRCLHLVIRNRKVFLGFFSDDLGGVTDLIASRWYHTAFVFDRSTRTQFVYLDGVLDNTQQANDVYRGTSGFLNIGVNYWWGSGTYFNGLIDRKRPRRSSAMPLSLSTSHSMGTRFTIKALS